MNTAGASQAALVVTCSYQHLPCPASLHAVLSSPSAVVIQLCSTALHSPTLLFLVFASFIPFKSAKRFHKDFFLMGLNNLQGFFPLLVYSIMKICSLHHTHPEHKFLLNLWSSTSFLKIHTAMKRNSQLLCGFLQEATDMNGRVSATGELFATQHF